MEKKKKMKRWKNGGNFQHKQTEGQKHLPNKIATINYRYLERPTMNAQNQMTKTQNFCFFAEGLFGYLWLAF